MYKRQTLYRTCLKRERDLNNKLVWAFLLFIVGVAAGWCNENTSGGGILMSLFFIGFSLYSNSECKKPRFWMFAGIVGQIIGFLFMILAPGNMARSLVQEEEHTGFFALLSRFQKIILAVRNNFLILLIIGLSLIHI